MSARTFAAGLISGATGTARGLIVSTWLALIFFGLPVLTFLPLPLVLAPWQGVRRLGAVAGDWIIFLVSDLLRWGFVLSGNARWQVKGLEALHEDRTCILLSNHRSWADPLIMHAVLGRRLPPRRFLIKRELTWIPLFGQALVAVGMPALRRASHRAGRKSTQMARIDQQRLHKACSRFDVTSSTIAIFAEGTRFTPAKHQRTESPFRHLLPPRTGGLFTILENLPQVENIYDCTCIYSEPSFSLWDFLCGRVRAVEFHVRRLEVPAELRAEGADKKARRQWLEALWVEKDQLIGERLAGPLGAAHTRPAEQRASVKESGTPEPR